MHLLSDLFFKHLFRSSFYLSYMQNMLIKSSFYYFLHCVAAQTVCNVTVAYNNSTFGRYLFFDESLKSYYNLVMMLVFGEIKLRGNKQIITEIYLLLLGVRTTAFTFQNMLCCTKQNKG